MSPLDVRNVRNARLVFKLPMLFSVLAALTPMLESCRTVGSQDNSLASVVTPDQNIPGNYIVYFKETSGQEMVYRKSCAPSAVMTPTQCPTTPSTAEMPWGAYEKALLSQGVSVVTVNGVREALGSQTAWDAAGQNDLAQKMEKAFGIDVSSKVNPFPKTFIGAPTNGSVQIPSATTTSMVLAKDLVLAEMRDAEDYFSTNDSTYRGAAHPFQQDAIVTSSIRNSCFANGLQVNYWSDIVFHYYCQFGQLRSCFTGRVTNATKDYDGYKQGYDYCLANDSDFRRYFAGTQAGVDYDRRRSVFQHVMFSVYAAGRTSVFDRNDQDNVINDFYKSASNCSLRPNIPRQSSDPLFRASGQHCGTTQQANNNSTIGNRKICSTATSTIVRFEIDAPAQSSVTCFFDGTPFSTTATYSSASARWVCGDWGRGNPQYKINIRVDGVDNVTDENSALAAPCGAQGAGTTQSTTQPSGLAQDVCATAKSGLVSFQIKGSPSAKVDCTYDGSPFGSASTFSTTTNRWACADWGQGNPGYKINVIVDGVSHLTDENTALANACK